MAYAVLHKPAAVLILSLNYKKPYENQTTKPVIYFYHDAALFAALYASGRCTGSPAL